MKTGWWWWMKTESGASEHVTLTQPNPLTPPSIHPLSMLAGLTGGHITLTYKNQKRNEKVKKNSSFVSAPCNFYITQSKLVCVYEDLLTRALYRASPSRCSSVHIDIAYKTDKQAVQIHDKPSPLFFSSLYARL